MKYLLIMNPGSRGGSSSKRFKEIFSLLDTAGVQYDHYVTASLEDAYNISKEGNKGGYDVIVAVGGDGTLNRVLNGFYDENGFRISKAKMGVIYTGTSPDFCKSYGIPTRVGTAVEVLLKGQSRRIQIGKIDLIMKNKDCCDGLSPGEAGGLETRYFACCANIGLGAVLARNANSGIRKMVGDYPGTFLALLKTLAGYRPCEYTVCCDNRAERLMRVHNISIGRSFYIASGIKVNNALTDSDGLFYNLTVNNLKARNLINVIKKMYSGKTIVNDGIVDLKYNKTVEIYGNSINPEVEFDGDPAGFLPCRIEAAEDELEIIFGGQSI